MTTLNRSSDALLDCSSRCGIGNETMRVRIARVIMGSLTENPMNPKQAKRLGAFIRTARERHKLSQNRLAQLVGDVPNSTILRLERGENLTPRPDLLADIANVLGIKLADLYALADYTAPNELPTLTPYLRTKYRDLPEGDVKAISAYAAKLMQQRGVDLAGPAPGEDEEPEQPVPRARATPKKTLQSKKKGGTS